MDTLLADTLELILDALATGDRETADTLAAMTPEELADLMGNHPTGHQFVIPLRGGSVSESAPGLTEKEITVHRDGQTFTQHRKVRSGDGPSQPARASGTGHEVSGDDARQVAEAVDLNTIPGLPSDPTVRKALKEKVGHVAVQVAKHLLDPKLGFFLVASNIDKIASIWGLIGDEPDDFKKLGYNPSFGATGQNATLDTLKNNTQDLIGYGVSSTMAIGLIQKLVPPVLGLIRKKLGFVKESVGGEMDWEMAGEALRGILAVCAEKFGLTEPPTAEEITGKLRTLLGGS